MIRQTLSAAVCRDVAIIRSMKHAARSGRPLILAFLCGLLWSIEPVLAQTNPVTAQDQQQKTEFFEKTIRPLLVRHCYECHSGASNAVKGGLRLDFREAVQKGGDSGPVVVAGNPEESLLLQAVRHEGLEMPPGKKLSDSEIQNVTEWIRAGAFDPRDHPPDSGEVAVETFEAIYKDRRQWWSLQPIQEFQPPQVEDAQSLKDIDRFVVSRLRDQQLKLAPVADPGTLARRASFALTGLPPSKDSLNAFLKNKSSDAWEEYVATLLASPHFGERWARHWMDVVRYTDTYGYEWDMPAKGAWRYRDYLTRAFNGDIPFDQLIREQIAGDLLESPRLNHTQGINESRIGPMFYQMGEKRHGDSAEFNGIHQEMLDNKIDAFGKAFLATTIACARCHDHKLDAISQRDYYALGGLFMSARWVTNTVDLPERNAEIREQLKQVKQGLRSLLAERWLENLNNISVESLVAIGNATAARTLEDPLYAWSQAQASQAAGKSIADTWNLIGQQYRDENVRRSNENAGHFSLVADFRDSLPEGWSSDGEGLRDITPRGDFVIALDGDKVVESVLLGGLCTNSLSPRMNGALRTPWTKSIGNGNLSFEVAGGDFAARRVVVDNAFLTERQQYLVDRVAKWQMVDGLSSLDRNVYVEFATKTSNPNFPPRVGLGGACSEEQAADPRSWFQISRVVRHVAPFSPLDELTYCLPLFEADAPAALDEVILRYQVVLKDAVIAWRQNEANDDDVRLLNWMLSTGLLRNDATAATAATASALASASASALDSAIYSQVQRYRELERKLAEPETVNGMVDIDSALDYRLNIRGDYDQLGSPVPHGVPELLADICGVHQENRNRLELAELVASAKNPLTARVYVNRVWHWMFGAGLVTTTDDFGHLGDRPSHPQLLDYLSRRFMEDGWSTKKLVRDILESRTWQQSQQADARAMDVDPANRLLHHFPVQRLDAESLRDAMLVVSGRLDASLYGPTTNPCRLSEDSQKRLFSGPLDGQGRRSIYTKVTIMEPPRFLATFNQPSPKIPAGRRDVTTTPAQSLTLLNDPFVMDQAAYWARQLIVRPDRYVESRLQHMFLKAFGREAASEELSRWADAVGDFAVAEQLAEGDWLSSEELWQTMAHAMFNTKEFLYVR